MTSGPTQGQGGLSPVTDPAHFPSSFDTLVNKTAPTQVLYNGTNSTGSDLYTTDKVVGNCESFTVYVQGTGTWNIQVAPHNNNPESFWTDIGSDQSNSGFIHVTSAHPHMRMKIATGSTLIIWLYRKYSTY